MKSFARAGVTGLLAMLARAVLAKYRPTIVMVTGSVGKTSTKDAVAVALASHFHLRASEKSYNSEFGVPLTIFGVKNPWSSLPKWLGVIREALALILLPSHYPKLLVLEVGADRPGDLARILRIATPDALVVTRLPDVPVHVEAYTTPEAVREEEFLPAYALPDGAPLVISSRDENAKRMAANTHGRVITVGFGKGADVHIGEPTVRIEKGRVVGMQAELMDGSTRHTLTVAGALGKPQVLAPASGYAMARALGVSAKEALAGLDSYVPPTGRCHMLRGIHNSVLIDDTYNSSPAAAREALAALALVPKPSGPSSARASAGRHIAVLGDMLELGRYSVAEHEHIGALAAKQVDMLVAVGIRSRATADAALAAGMKEEQVLRFDTAAEAAKALPVRVMEGDAILVKGSQSIRTERIMEALLADSADRSKLVRQEKEWKRRK